MYVDVLFKIRGIPYPVSLMHGTDISTTLSSYAFRSLGHKEEYRRWIPKDVDKDLGPFVYGILNGHIELHALKLILPGTEKFWAEVIQTKLSRILCRRLRGGAIQLAA